MIVEVSLGLLAGVIKGLVKQGLGLLEGLVVDRVPVVEGLVQRLAGSELGAATFYLLKLNYIRIRYGSD